MLLLFAVLCVVVFRVLLFVCVLFYVLLILFCSTCLFILLFFSCSTSASISARTSARASGVLVDDFLRILEIQNSGIQRSSTSTVKDGVRFATKKN